MPTGFSSGGGSSHSSGGGNIGGGGFGGGRYPRGFFGPGVVIINNRPYRMGKASIGYFINLILIFVLVIVAMAGGGMMANASSLKKTIKYEFIKYQDLIEFVENDREAAIDRIVEGQIKSIEPGYGKYRVIYEFDYQNYEGCNGYSFYVYTQEDLRELNYRVGAKIYLAIDPSIVNNDGPDSIPMDFEDFDVEDDGEYVEANFNFKIGVGMLVGGIVGVVLLIIANHFILKKHAQPVEDGKNNGNSGNNDNNNNNDGNATGNSDEDEITYCSYCGARIKKGEQKCPNCGAKN